MTTAKKIKILNNQINKLGVDEASLNTFYISNWRTETLEFIRIFFGEQSEPYKTCKKYNDETDEEHKTKNYEIGSAIWTLRYTDMLFSDIGILQHNLYKKSKVLQFIHGLSLPAIVSIIGLVITIAFYVGKYDGIKLGQSMVPVLDNTKNIPNQDTSHSTTYQSKKNHTDTIKGKVKQKPKLYD